MGPAFSATASAPSAPTSTPSAAAQMRRVRRSRVAIACLPLLRLEPRGLDDTLGDHAVLLEIAREIGGPGEDRLRAASGHVLFGGSRAGARPPQNFFLVWGGWRGGGRGGP